MFPKFLQTTLKTLVGKGCGTEIKEREREGHASEGDFLGILRDKRTKSRRKRGSALTIAVSSTKAWSGFIGKKGNLGNSDGNRFFNYLFIFNRDFQIFLPILF